MTKKIWYLLNPQQHQAALVLLFLMLIGMVLETLGIGLIMPIMVLIIRNDLFNHYPILESFLSQGYSHTQLIIISVCLLAGVYTIKNLYLGYFTWQQVNFIFRVRAYFSQQLFTAYLNQPYPFHLQHNSAQLIRNVMNEVNMFAKALQAVLVLLAEGFVFIGITALLCYLKPLPTIVALVALLLAIGGIQFITRGTILNLGKQRQYHEGLRIQHLQQGFSIAKEIKLLQREDSFLEHYTIHNTASARVEAYQRVLHTLPRLYLELFAIFGLVIMVLVAIWQGNKSMLTLLPILSLFAAVILRFMPLLNRLLNAAQTLRFNLPAVTTLYDEMKLINRHATKQQQQIKQTQPLSFYAVLTLDNIRFSYDTDDRIVLDNINLTIRKGTTVGLVGVTGSGKTTLVDIILGLLEPDSGAVRVDGIDISNNYISWQSQIGYVPQSVALIDSSIRDNIAFGLPSEKIAQEAVLESIRTVQLGSFIKDLPDGIDTLIGEHGIRLSGGQRQRIAIARALYHKPAILIMDEATSSLDAVTEKNVMQAIGALQGTETVLIITHRLSTLENCQQIFCLADGKIVQQH